MAKVPVPPKAALDADTDQGLAYTRDVRGALAASGAQGKLLLYLAEGLARPLREQFPGVPAGRVLMSATRNLLALKLKFADLGLDDAQTLLTVATLAAEELDREGGDGSG